MRLPRYCACLTLTAASIALADQVPIKPDLSAVGDSHWRALFGDAWDKDSNLHLQKHDLLKNIPDYNGIVTLFGVPPMRCYGKDAQEPFDIAVLGAPFDTSTTFRPGARFGPNAIRQGSRRIQKNGFSYNVPMRFDPLKDESAPVVIDCGDIPMSLFDNKLALEQLQQGYGSLLHRRTITKHSGKTSLAKDGKFHPRIIALGGDHSIILPILREVHKVYGPVAVLHFDSHLDSWRPSRIFGEAHAPFSGKETDLPITHGSMLYVAAAEGLIANGSSIHVGIRTPLLDMVDYETDEHCGFSIVEAEEVEDIGYKGVVERIRAAVGDTPVYVSIDIDTIDPSMSPGTGTPEIGGLTTREMKKILHALDGLKVVGVDIVEVSPSYDSSELTEITAANLAWEMLTVMAKTPA